MKTLRALLFIASLTVPGVAAADAVTEWNEIAVATAAAGKHGASDASRTTALVHAALFDAVNAIEARRIADGRAKADGIAVGEKVGAEMVALRASDGATAPNVYRPVTAPGVYVVTTLPVSSHWGNLTPWVLDRASQVRPGPPPALTNSEWARDCNEVKEIGGTKSTVRTAEQTDIARFWAVVGPASWDPLLRAVAAAPGRSLLD